MVSGCYNGAWLYYICDRRHCAFSVCPYWLRDSSCSAGTTVIYSECFKGSYQFSLSKLEMIHTRSNMNEIITLNIFCTQPKYNSGTFWVTEESHTHLSQLQTNSGKQSSRRCRQCSCTRSHRGPTTWNAQEVKESTLSNARSERILWAPVFTVKM